MRIETSIPGLYFLGLTDDCKVRFEKDGEQYVTTSNLGQLKSDPSIRIVSKIDIRMVGNKDVLIFKKGA